MAAKVTDSMPDLAPVYSLIDKQEKIEKFEQLSEKEFQQQIMSNMRYKIYYRSATLNFQKTSIQGFLFKA